VSSFSEEGIVAMCVRRGGMYLRFYNGGLAEIG
jgi:hypothetical protein